MISQGKFLCDRTSALPDKHHAIAFGFRYEAATSTLRAVTRSLIAFDHGIDDSCKFPSAAAGYSTPSVANNSVDVTDCYKGGAFSITDHAQLLSVTLVPSGNVRVVRQSDVIADANGTPQFPRTGDRISDVRSMHDDLVAAVCATSEAYLMPPGDANGCDAYLGATRTMLGRDLVLRTEAFVEPNAYNDAKFKPNRLRFDFSDVANVALRNGVTAPNDGDYAVIDCDVLVNFANVTFASSDVTSECIGIDENDRAKIRAWREAVSRIASSV